MTIFVDEPKKQVKRPRLPDVFLLNDREFEREIKRRRKVHETRKVAFLFVFGLFLLLFGTMFWNFVAHFNLFSP